MGVRHTPDYRSSDGDPTLTPPRYHLILRCYETCHKITKKRNNRKQTDVIWKPVEGLKTVPTETDTNGPKKHIDSFQWKSLKRSDGKTTVVRGYRSKEN